MATKDVIEAMDLATLKAYLEGLNPYDLKQALEIINRPTLRHAIEVIDSGTLKHAVNVIDRPTLKIALEVIDVPTLRNALESLTEDKLKTGLEDIDRQTLKNGLEHINNPTLRHALEDIDRATLWVAMKVIDDATYDNGLTLVDDATGTNMHNFRAIGTPDPHGPVNIEDLLAEIRARLSDICGALAKGNKASVSIDVTFQPPNVIHYEGHVRCRQKISGIDLYDVTIDIPPGNIDLTNPESVKDMQVCVQLPLGLGNECVTLEQVFDLVAAFATAALV